MKKFMFLLFVIPLLSSCQNGNNPVDNNNEFIFTAKVGNNNWQGKSYLDFANDNEQALFLMPDENFNYLVISFKFNGIGEYNISNSKAALVETIGGDVIKGKYHSSSQQNDVLIIDYFDENKGIIKGTFNFKIVKQSSTIDVTGGNFTANFINNK